MENQSTKHKPRRWWRRLVLMVVIIVLASVGLFAFLKWYFPSQFVIHQTEKFLKRSYGWEVTIAHASIDPFARIELDNIVISPVADQPPALRIKSVRLGYETLPLLFHRELKIHEVYIDSPALDVRTLPDGRGNFEPLIKPFITADTTALVLPFLLNLDRCDVSSISVSLTDSTETTDLSADFGSLSLHGRQLTGTSVNDFRGTIAIDIPDAKLHAHIGRPVEANVEAELTAKSTIDIDAGTIRTQLESRLIPNCQGISYQQWKPESLPDMSFSTDLSCDLLRKTVAAKSFQLVVDPVRISANVNATFDAAMTWSLGLAETMPMELTALLKTIKDLNLSPAGDFQKIPSLTGSLSLDKFKVSGHGFQPGASNFGASVSGGISLDIPKLEAASPVPIRCESISASLEFGAEYSDNEITSGYAKLTGIAKSVHLDSSKVPITIDSISWVSNAVIVNHGKTIQWNMQAGIGKVLDGTVNLISEATLDIPLSLQRKPEALQVFSLHADLSDLDMSSFGNGEWGGRASTALQLDKGGDGSISADGILDVKSPWFVINNVHHDVPDLHQRLALGGKVNLSSQIIDLSPISWQWSDIADASLNLTLHAPEFRAEITHSQLDISNLRSFLPADILPEIVLDSLKGIIIATGSIQGSLTDPLSSKFNLSVSLQQLAINVIEPKTTISNTSATLRANGALESIKGSLRLLIGEGGVSDRLPHLFKDAFFYTEFQLNGVTLSAKRELSIDSLRINFPELAFTGVSSGRLNLDHPLPVGKLWFTMKVNPNERLTIWDTLSYSGSTNLHGDVVIDSSMAAFNGELHWTDVNINIGSVAAVKNLNGRIPIWQKIDLATMSPVTTEPEPMAHRAMGFPSYSSLQSSYKWTMPVFGAISIDSLNMMNYGISNCSIDATWADGYFEAPSFQCDAYGGNIQGSLWVKLSGMVPDSLKAWFGLQVAGIQSGQIVKTSSQNPEESIISGDADLTVQGMPGSPNFDVYGGADITRIGRGVALDLLQIMDPEGQDEGIQSTRRYLSQGWGVKIFSFKIRDGFVYSYIVPTAPPPSKLHMFLLSKIVRLPPQITYGRIPIKFFLR